MEKKRVPTWLDMGIFAICDKLCGSTVSRLPQDKGIKETYHVLPFMFNNEFIYLILVKLDS